MCGEYTRMTLFRKYKYTAIIYTYTYMNNKHCTYIIYIKNICIYVWCVYTHDTIS